MATLEAIINILSDFEQEISTYPAYGNEKGKGSLPQNILAKLEDRVRDFDLNEIQEGVDEIPRLWKRSNRINYRNTYYGMKHRMERYLCGYISNGNFIIAMILSGFKGKFNKGKCKVKHVNCCFNAKQLELPVTEPYLKTRKKSSPP